MKVTYYVAISLDGFIATPDGGVDWLTPFQESGEDYGYADFLASVDSLLIGSSTYEFMLGHPPWLHPDKPSWVFTTRDLELAHESVELTSRDPLEVLAELRSRGLRSAWLMGGGKLASAFRDRGIISHYVIAVVPIVLGSGIPLLAAGGPQDRLRLIGTESYSSGIVMLSYERRTP